MVASVTFDKDPLLESTGWKFDLLDDAGGDVTALAQHIRAAIPLTHARLRERIACKTWVAMNCAVFGRPRRWSSKLAPCKTLTRRSLLF